MEPSGLCDLPKGAVCFALGRSVAKMSSISEEIYTMTGSASIEGKIYWSVKVKGDAPRDGRYVHGRFVPATANVKIEGYTPKDKRDRLVEVETDPNVKWSYDNDCIWETIDGNYLDTTGRYKLCLAFLFSGAKIADTTKDKEVPLWSAGAILIQDVITTPVGRFSNCLKNVTIIRGKNLEDILLKNALPEFADDETFSLTGGSFGKFVTISFYAKDVGLVKEAQYNYKGEKTYELELIEYKINRAPE